MNSIINSSVFACYQLMRLVVLVLPPSLSRTVFRTFGSFLLSLQRREWLIADAQLLTRLGIASQSERRKIFKNIGANFGESLVEVLLADRLLAGLGTFKENLDLQQVGGCIIISAHLSNFELIAAYYARQNARFRPIGRVPNFPSLEPVLNDLRERNNVKTIWREDPRSAATMVRLLKGGEAIAALIDQDTELESQFSPFFGIPAATPIAPIKLALRCKLPIYSSFIVRTAPWTYAIENHKIDFDPDAANAIDEILAVFHQRLETSIRRYPEQWVWWHRRWRRRPAGEQPTGALMNTEQYIDWIKRTPHA